MIISAISIIITLLKVDFQKRSFGISLSAVQFFLSLAALGALVACFALSDFSVLLVANHSHTINPLIFKISAAWGNHEGSMLLWLMCMAFYKFIYNCFGVSNAKDKMMANAIQSFMILLFTAFILVASNPFIRVFPSPIQGLGFNPILQDIGLAMHPPILYLGYVGSSMVFSIITAAMLGGTLSVEAIKDLRFVTLIFWIFLTLGISLGSWWAYRELGWGGYWFWDPVENASLMPWIAATALFHSIMAASKSEHMKIWIILLSLITFLLSVMGTFLVRSGLLTSVHSFAIDQERGLFILAMFTIFTLGSFIIFAFRANKFLGSDSIDLQTKTGMIVLQNITLIFMLFIVFIATLYPLLTFINGGSSAIIGVGYYNFFNKISAILLLIFCIFGYLVKWSKASIVKSIKLNAFSVLLALVIALNLILIFQISDFYMILIIILSIILGVLTIKNIVAKVRNLQFAYVASSISHAGFALLTLSIAVNQFLQFDVQKIMKLNEVIDFENYSLKYNDIGHFKMQNYIARRANIEIFYEGHSLGSIEPELRLYPVENQTTVEAAILTHHLNDVYVVIGDMTDDMSLNITCYVRPFVKVIWLSCFLIIFGAIVNVLRLISSRINGRKLLPRKNS